MALSETNTTPLYIFIDESGTDKESTILYMSLILTEDPTHIQSECKSLTQKIIRDPELSQKIPSVRNNGIEHFHYTSDHPEIRDEFIKLLPVLNFDAYVCFVRKDEIVGDLSKIELLKTLFSTLLYPRILERHYDSVYVIYEKFDEGSASDERILTKEVEQLCQKIKEDFRKTIKQVTISFDNKDELCLGVSDYVCGIISAYFSKQLTEGNAKDSQEERNYDRISGKIRLIQDLTRKKFYSRREPLEIEFL